MFNINKFKYYSPLSLGLCVSYSLVCIRDSAPILSDMHRSLGETKHKCSAYIQSCVQCFCMFSRLVNLTLLCTPNLDSLANSSWYQLLYSSHHLPGSCGFLTKSKNMHRVKLFDSKFTVSVNGRVSLSWPRCILPLTLWQLGLAPAPPTTITTPTLNWINRRKMDWWSFFSVWLVQLYHTTITQLWSEVYIH